MSSERILVAMSGGVDSSVAAALLAEQGHQLVGATMKTFCYQEEAGPSRTCCGLDGIMDARRVADALDIPHYVFDVEEEFSRDVIDDFVSEYARGRTPTPASGAIPTPSSGTCCGGESCSGATPSLPDTTCGPGSCAGRRLSSGDATRRRISPTSCGAFRARCCRG